MSNFEAPDYPKTIIKGDPEILKRIVFKQKRLMLHMIFFSQSIKDDPLAINEDDNSTPAPKLLKQSYLTSVVNDRIQLPKTWYGLVTRFCVKKMLDAFIGFLVCLFSFF